MSYTWDGNGNLLSDGVNAYSYNHADRLTAVSSPQYSIQNGYNGLGDRLRQTVNGLQTNYALDLNNSISQVLSDGSNTYLYGLGRIAQQNVVGRQYYLGDALGSVRQLTNAAGAVTEARSYEPFGKQLNAAGNPLTKYAFTGEWQDPTGLIYLRARYYDPATGRFLSKDPVRGSIAIPSTLNPYTYAVNNPLLYTDPSGEFPFLLIIAGGLLGGAIYGYGSQVINNMNQGMCLGDALNTNIDWLSFWMYTGVGGLIGVGISGAAFGGWWIGVRVGLWGGINTGIYTVYQYVENGVTRYIGQTNNFVIRAQTHLDNRGWMVERIKGLEHLSKFDARAVEQALIEYYGLENLYNIYNSISASNPIYPEAMQRATEILTRIGFLK